MAEPALIRCYECGKLYDPDAQQNKPRCLCPWCQSLYFKAKDEWERWSQYSHD